MGSPCAFTDIVANPRRVNNVNDFIVQFLQQIGVKHACGIPGGGTVDMYMALQTDTNIDVFLTRHECNAGFIANGMSRLWLRRGGASPLSVAFSCQGPGVLNMVPAIEEANMEHLPSIFISDQNTSPRSIQNFDTSHLSGLTKHLVIVTGPESTTDIVNAVMDAFRIPFGPVLLVIDHVAKRKKMDDFSRLDNISKPSIHWPVQADNSVIEALVDALKKSRKPIFLFGVGCEAFVNECRQLVDRLRVPCVCTLPMSSFKSFEDPLFALRMGHTATACGNRTAMSADLVIAFGTSFNIYTTGSDRPFSEQAHVINVNLQTDESAACVTRSFQSDAHSVIVGLLNTTIEIGNTDRWLNKIREFKLDEEEWRRKHCHDEYLCWGNALFGVQKLADKYVNKGKQVCIVSDTGSAQPFTASYIDFRDPRYEFFTASKFAHMGAGLGHSIAYALSDRDCHVILVAGDGAFCQFMGDLSTIQEKNLQNLTIVLADNAGIGLINEEADEFMDSRLHHANGYRFTPNIASIVRGMGLSCLTTSSTTEWMQVMQKDAHSVYVAVLPFDEYYSPLVHIGKPLSEMVHIDFNINHPYNSCRHRWHAENMADQITHAASPY